MSEEREVKETNAALELKADDKDYISLQGFFHTVLRNIGLCMTVSLAIMTLNRYWRSKSIFITIITWFIALLFLLLSIYISHTLLTDDAITSTLMNKWKTIVYIIVVCQVLLILSYGFIGKVVFTEVIFEKNKRKERKERSRARKSK